jgi:hypothetical protein
MCIIILIKITGDIIIATDTATDTVEDTEAVLEVVIRVALPLNEVLAVHLS